MPKTDDDITPTQRLRSQHGIIDDPNPHAVPGEVFDELTQPVTLIERSGDKYSTDMQFRDELNAMRDKYDSDLAYRALYNMVRRQKRESNSSLSKIADSTLETHAEARQRHDDITKIADLVKWKTEVDTILRLVKWVLGFVIAATLGSVIVITTKIYVWGESNGALENRVETLERANPVHYLEKRSQ